MGQLKKKMAESFADGKAGLKKADNLLRALVRMTVSSISEHQSHRCIVGYRVTQGSDPSECLDKSG